MPEAVPMLLPPAPAPKPAAPAPPSRAMEPDRPSFHDELKAKASRPAAKEKKEPAKAEASKPAPASKQKSASKAPKPQKGQGASPPKPEQDPTDQPPPDQLSQDESPLPRDSDGESKPPKKDRTPEAAKKDQVILQTQPVAAPVQTIVANPKKGPQPAGDQSDSTDLKKPAKAAVQPITARSDSVAAADAEEDGSIQEQADPAQSGNPVQSTDTQSASASHPKLGEVVAPKPQTQDAAVQAAADPSASQADDAPQQDLPDAAPQEDFATQLAAARTSVEPSSKEPTKPPDQTPPPTPFILTETPHAKGATGTATAATPAQVPAPTEAQFADANHARIVSGIHGQLLPNGGSMHLRLDPPELGAVNVRVEMKDGVMTASFETNNDQATKLLSHSLSDLKSALEAQGVAVEKLHVRQAQPEQSRGDDNRQREPDRQQQQQANQEQQRKEMLRRMWRRLMKGQDPLDLVA